MKKFDTLLYDMHRYLQGMHSYDLELQHSTAKNIVKLAKNVATHTLEMVNHKAPERKDPKSLSIRMSELGTPCYRQLIFKWYMPEFGSPPYAEPAHPTLPVKFTYGDYIEELVLFLAEESGHTVQDRQKEVTLTTDESDWYAVGHMDAVIDGVVVDVKSAADVSFQKYKREGLTDANDTFGYLWQLDAYAATQKTMERAFIFANKHDGAMEIIPTTGLLRPIREKIDSIGRVAQEYIYAGDMPASLPVKLGKFGPQLGTICSYCNYKYTCYDGNIDGYIVSGRPVYLLHPLTPEGEALAKKSPKIARPSKYS